jgi:hypothetical protein
MHAETTRRPKAGSITAGVCVRLLAVGTFVLLASPAAAGDGAPGELAKTLEGLIARFHAMPGFSARFEEERRIALLETPLRSRGTVHFVPPALLLRRVTEPSASLLRLDANRFVFTDAYGSETFDLGANPVARVFAHTFTDVLAGDLERLRASYEIDFRPETATHGPESAWRMELTPSDPALARAISGLSLRGHGLVVLDLEVRERGGDATFTRFADVDPDRRFEDAEIQRLLRPPLP